MSNLLSIQVKYTRGCRFEGNHKNQQIVQELKMLYRSFKSKLKLNNYTKISGMVVN